jgi:hypothetical protein
MKRSIKDIYYDPNSPGSYGGVEALKRQAKLEGHEGRAVEEFLKSDDAYTLHKPSRVRFKRNPTIVGGIDKQWQADLADMSELAHWNKGYTFLLNVIDCFSKYAWSVPIHKKDAPNMLAAFKTLLTQSAPRKPQRLQTDKGTEFLNKSVQDLLRDNGISHFTTENATKASMVERFNRTLKTKMWRYFTANKTKRYIDVLPQLMNAYNHSMHRTIGMRPVDVSEANELDIWRRVYVPKLSSDTKVKHKPNEPVRILSQKGVFKKGYKPNWSSEVFQVKGDVTAPKRVYKVAGLFDNDPLRGTFYPEELESVTFDHPPDWVIDKVLKKDKKAKQVLVKWKGYSDIYNRWIPEADVDRYVK